MSAAPTTPPESTSSATALVPEQAAPVEPPPLQRTTVPDAPATRETGPAPRIDLPHRPGPAPLAGIDVTPGAPASRRGAYWSLDSCDWVGPESC